MSAETSFLEEQSEFAAELAAMPAECARMIASLLDALHEQDRTVKLLLALNHKLANN